jgi:hypothetical protein
MPFVVGKSRNPIVQAAFEGLRKEQRAEKKAKATEPADAHKKPPKVSAKAPDVHKKAGKARTTAAPPTKPAKPPRAKGGKTTSRKK